MHYWSSANPREIHQRPLHSDWVSAVRNIENRDHWSLLFFDEDDRAVIVNSDRHVAMIQEFFGPALEELNAGLVWL